MFSVYYFLPILPRRIRLLEEDLAMRMIMVAGRFIAIIGLALALRVAIHPARGDWFVVVAFQLT